ncbi:hypothetical protein EVAR_28833_1 [Eumeta japonica]|uniref:Uncharacterized protein n=1 Tax=Eumeta variegata TaxID=151549 RepID=A0A4C1WHI7_EUMVA|nr:hypothetical protein EVAR_28833_1 [Eumeta japonica]
MHWRGGVVIEREGMRKRKKEGKEKVRSRSKIPISSKPAVRNFVPIYEIKGEDKSIICPLVAHPSPVAATQETVGNQPRTSIRRFSDFLGCFEDAIHCHLKSLGSPLRESSASGSRYELCFQKFLQNVDRWR